MAVFFALLTLIGWGVGDLFGAIAARKIGYLTAFFWMMVFSFVLASFYIPFAQVVTDWSMFGLALALNIFDLYGSMMYFKALEIGNASLVGAIAGSFGLISAIISIIFFGERLNTFQGLGMILATIGVILASFDFSQLREKKFGKLLREPAIRYAFVTLFVWGIYYAVVRIPVSQIGWFWPQYSWHGLFVLLIILGRVKGDAFKIFADKKQVLVVWLFALFLVLGVFSYNLGITFGYTSIVAPIAGSATVLFVILTRLVFKEKLTSQQKVGIISSLVGIVLISFSIG